MEMKISTYLADIVMDAPQAFTIYDDGDEHVMMLYPPSLGKMLLYNRVLDKLGINGETLAKMPILEVVRVVGVHREDCIRLIAYATAKDKGECFNLERMKWMTTMLDKSLNDEDVASLVIHILTSDKSADVSKHYGIDEEQEGLSSVSKAKAQGGSISFGGKTILGALIDQACERYGWSHDYVVWGISFATLRLMLADKVSTVYVSEDDKKKIPSRILQKGEDVIKATKENMDMIKSMYSWK
jgi:hypothetical protein